MSEVYYHGSIHKLKQLEPRYSKLVDMYVTYAANDLWLAIYFIAKAADNMISAGYIDGKPYIMEKIRDAFNDCLKGKKGYVHLVNPGQFGSHEKLGLKGNEFISEHPVDVIEIIEIEDVFEALKKTRIRIISFEENLYEKNKRIKELTETNLELVRLLARHMSKDELVNELNKMKFDDEEWMSLVESLY